MATTPTICFNESSASSNDYFNHSEIYEYLGLFENGKTSLNTGESSDVLDVFITHNHTSELTDVSFYIIPSTGSTSAELINENVETYNIILDTNDLFIIKLNDNTFNYEIKLTPGSARTAEQICEEINDTINELVAFEDNGYIKLKSAAKGLTSKIYIIDTNNTANTILGFNNVDDVIPISTGTTSNWGQKGNGSCGKSVSETLIYPFTITSDSNDKFNLSLNYTSDVECVLLPGVVTNDVDLELLVNTCLTTAGFSITTDVVCKVEDNTLIITSFLTEDNTSVRISIPSEHSCLDEIKMLNSIETGTDYSNSSNVNDRDELISWGDSSYGLEIGELETSLVRIETGIGDLVSTAIPLNWGDGSTINDVLPFDYTNTNTDGEINLKLKLSVPPDESETGFREWSLAIQFTYI